MAYGQEVMDRLTSGAIRIEVKNKCEEMVVKVKGRISAEVASGTLRLNDRF